MISEFAKEKVFWTRKMNVKLVKFIEKRPNIWNPKHSKYTSIAHRDRTYAEFASKYGNEFTGQAVKDRWTNIRSTFANYLRKLKASRARGNEQVYKINWHLWEPCKFLLRVNRKAIHKTNQLNDDIKSDTSEVKEDLSSEEEHTDQEHSEIDISCQNVANGILSVFRGVQNDVFGIDNTKYSHVGQKITECLSQMSSYEAAKVSHKISDILLMYHKNNPLNPNNLKSEKIDNFC